MHVSALEPQRRGRRANEYFVAAINKLWLPVPQKKTCIAPTRLPAHPAHSMTFIRFLFMLLVSRVHLQFPESFDLADTPHPPCRIFSRPAFSQSGCGACAAFAVATAFAVRECVQRGVDAIPSPHQLFNCADGRCSDGLALEPVVNVLGGAVADVDDVAAEEAVFELSCMVEQTMHAWDPRRLAVFDTDYRDALLLKAELYVYRNPIIGVIVPDRDMALYPRTRCDGECEAWVKFSDGETVSVGPPSKPLPVYRVGGPRLHPHAVVVLGWGSVPEPHWVVRNSWGAAWGENGRANIAMADLAGAAVLDSRAKRDVWLLFLFCSVILSVAAAADLRRGAEVELDCAMV